MRKQPLREELGVPEKHQDRDPERGDRPRKRGWGSDSERKGWRPWEKARQREGDYQIFRFSEWPQDSDSSEVWWRLWYEPLCPICSWELVFYNLVRTGILHPHFVSSLSWSTLLRPRVHPIFLAHFGYSQHLTVFLIHALDSRDLTFDSTSAWLLIPTSAETFSSVALVASLARCSSNCWLCHGFAGNNRSSYHWTMCILSRWESMLLTTPRNRTVFVPAMQVSQEAPWELGQYRRTSGHYALAFYPLHDSTLIMRFIWAWCVHRWTEHADDNSYWQGRPLSMHFCVRPRGLQTRGAVQILGERVWYTAVMCSHSVWDLREGVTLGTNCVNRFSLTKKPLYWLNNV